jgi:hypothetical protein
MIRTGLLLIITVLIGGAFAQGWISDYLSPSPEEVSNQRQRISALPSHMGESISAQYAGLSEVEQNAIRANLKQQLQPVDDWIQSIALAKPQLLCLGEEHEQTTRSFLAEKIFSQLQFDTLMLETTPAGLGSIIRGIETNPSFVSLEGANISPIISAAREQNSNLTITGIEETKPQRLHRIKQSNTGFRDDTLAQNFWKQFQPGQRHALIMGALHCGNNANWLYAQIKQNSPEDLREHLINVRVFGEYQNESLQAMIYFLKEIGMTEKDFVILDTSLLHPTFKQWFALLEPTLRHYKTLLVFRTSNYIKTP